MGLVDQMVDRILFGPMQRTEIANVHAIAGKTGWSSVPEGYKSLVSEFPGDVLATDCSAFDWTFPEWLVEVTIRTRLEQLDSHDPVYERMARRRWFEVLGTDCVVRLPGGQRYRQLKPGLMKSGWYLTISVNSQAQELLTIAAYRRCFTTRIPKVWSMGDDVLMEWLGEDEEKFVGELRSLGILTKHALHRREFAGFEFLITPQGVRVNPLYGPKHRFLLAHTPVADLEEVLTSYALLYGLASDSVSEWVAPYLRRFSRWTKTAAIVWATGGLGKQFSCLKTKNAAGHFEW